MTRIKDGIWIKAEIMELEKFYESKDMRSKWTDENRIYLDVIVGGKQHNEKTLQRLARPIDSHFIWELQLISVNSMSSIL